MLEATHTVHCSHLRSHYSLCPLSIHSLSARSLSAHSLFAHYALTTRSLSTIHPLFTQYSLTRCWGLRCAFYSHFSGSLTIHSLFAHHSLTIHYSLSTHYPLTIHSLFAHCWDFPGGRFSYSSLCRRQHPRCTLFAYYSLTAQSLSTHYPLTIRSGLLSLVALCCIASGIAHSSLAMHSLFIHSWSFPHLLHSSNHSLTIRSLFTHYSLTIHHAGCGTHFRDDW